MIIIAIVPFLAVLVIVAMCISELIRSSAVGRAIGVLIFIGTLRIITENFSFSLLLTVLNLSILRQIFDSRIYQLAWIVGTVYIVIAVVSSIFPMKKRNIK